MLALEQQSFTSGCVCRKNSGTLLGILVTDGSNLTLPCLKLTIRKRVCSPRQYRAEAQLRWDATQLGLLTSFQIFKVRMTLGLLGPTSFVRAAGKMLVGRSAPAIYC